MKIEDISNFKMDNQISQLIKENSKHNIRSLFAILGDDLSSQVMMLHHLVSKYKQGSSSVLWCHGPTSEIPRQKRKELKKLEKKVRQGQCDISKEDPYQVFLLSTPIKYCSYHDTVKVLGTTYSIAVLQDLEFITPNHLCRIVETVSGGGCVVFLLNDMSQLSQLGDINSNIHHKLKTHLFNNIQPLFNKRFSLSFNWCNTFLLLNNELSIVSPSINEDKQYLTSISDKHESQSVMLTELKESIKDAEEPLPQFIDLCKTVDQAKALLKMVDVITEKSTLSTVSLTAGRGRGKSAALGLAIATAIHYGITNIWLTSPSPTNLCTLFQFILKGFDILKFEDGAQYNIIESKNPEYNNAVIRIEVFNKHQQVIQYVDPKDAHTITQAELVVIDEAAAIPLTIVKSLGSHHRVFMASTINGYEGTGRSLSLKLLQQLRKQSSQMSKTDLTTDDQISLIRTLHEVNMVESIRYSEGDPVESWLEKLLCLTATTSPAVSCPPKEQCSLYYVNREVLFSGHSDSEDFLQEITALLVASHYRNSPDDLQVLADAPAHHLFVLLPPVTSAKLPHVLCVIQVCIEGGIPTDVAQNTLRRGDRPSGDLLPWTLSAQFSKPEFAQFTGVRIVRVATHTDYQGYGYGSTAISLLKNYYCKQFMSLKEDKNDTTDLPLLSKLSEKVPDDIDYLSVSYGVTNQLFKFWSKCGFIPLYVSQVENSVTGEHSCMMVLSLEEEEDTSPPWLRNMSTIFNKRFMNLLSSHFKKFSPTLAFEILNANKLKIEEDISWHELKGIMTGLDIQRIEKYCKNLADRYLITDLIPTIAKLFMSCKLPSVVLSSLQSILLVGNGLQLLPIDKVSVDIDLPVASAVGQFNRCLRKFHTSLCNIQEGAISKHLPKLTQEFVPVSISLDQDLEDGAEKFTKTLKENESGGDKNKRYQILGTEDDWNDAISNGVIKDTISIKTKRKLHTITEKELEKELNKPEPKKKRKHFDKKKN